MKLVIGIILGFGLALIVKALWSHDGNYAGAACICVFIAVSLSVIFNDIWRSR